MELPALPIDAAELRKTFRLHGGVLERFLIWKNQKASNPPVWRTVKNRANNSAGACVVGWNGALYLYHRIVWVLTTGADIPPGLDIDHIDGNRINNNFNNLRLVTNRENCNNRKRHRKGSLCGCYFYRKTNQWAASIRANGSRKFLGYYPTEADANKAYQIAKLRLTEGSQGIIRP